MANGIGAEANSLIAAAMIERLEPLRRYFAKRAPACEVDDLVQEVFVRLQAHGAQSGIESVDRYLFAVAGNVLIDAARRRTSRRQSAHESLTDSHHGTEHLTPERILLDREELDRVVRIIRDLPPRTRDIFVLHRFEEISCPRIAEQLGISVSAVEKHVMKALRVLQASVKAT